MDRRIESRARRAKLGAWHAGRASVLKWLALEWGDGILFTELVDTLYDMAAGDEKWARELLGVEDLDEWENALYIVGED